MPGCLAHGERAGGFGSKVREGEEDGAFARGHALGAGDADPSVVGRAGVQACPGGERGDAPGELAGDLGGVALVAERGFEVGGFEHVGTGDVHPARDVVGGLAAKRPVERVGGLGDGDGGDRGVDVRGIRVGEQEGERRCGG